MKEYTVNHQDEGQRLNRYLNKILPSLPQNLMYKFLRKKRIRVNGKKADASLRLTSGDIISLFIPENFFSPRNGIEIGQNKELNIIYSDINIAVLYKPKGLLSHPSKGSKDSLSERFINHMISTGEYTPSESVAFKPAICNRLDRGTEGIVVAAKNLTALREITGFFRDGMIRRFYLAAVIPPVPKDGRYHAYILKNKDDNIVSLSDEMIKGSKVIETSFRLYEKIGNIPVVEAELLTGKSHQIRAHLKHLKSGVVGDNKYGDIEFNRNCKVKGQLLISYRIKFSENITGSLEYLKGESIKVNTDIFLLKVLKADKNLRYSKK
ncbi:MAG: RluA family pseudouridine synthase [Ruminococcaceae bacterium]|nr:RluA family pseudouridine synthase [Oscillospiraceae bacterium]